MNQIIENLAQQNFDVRSVTAAGHFANSFSEKKWSKNRFENLIKDMFGIETKTEFDKEAEILFRYMIVEAIKLNAAGTAFGAEDVLKTARGLTSKFFVNFPWLHPDHYSQLAKSDFDEDGNYIGPKGYDDTVPVEDIKIGRTFIGTKIIKPKKGAKQHAARAIYDANVGKSNQEIIALFMNQLDMSKSGATTYLYNMKKGVAAAK